MNAYLEKIRKSGLKLTPRRRAIIKIFADCDTHLTPEEVWSRLKKRFKKCGFPSVYRNLETFVKCGILTRIQKFDRKKHYGLSLEDYKSYHHHIVCIKCKKIEDIKCNIGNIKEIKGYKVINHFMQIDGICSTCSKK